MMSELRVVVKPSASPYQPGSERRFVVVEDIHDDQGGGEERFKRCVELMQPSGQYGRQFLLLRRSIENLASWGRDLRAISQLRHEHVLGYRDAWQRSDDVSYTLYDVGRLFLSVCLREMCPRGPSGQVYPRWMYHVISALEYLHDQNNADQPMLHRAVQPDNILITDHCVLKLCAFHNGKRLADRHSTTSTVYGGGNLFQSPEIAAEISEGKGYNQAVDIWGFGVTAVYMANYDRAGKARSPEKLLTILRDSGQDGPTVSLVERCLGHSPQNRPTASHVVRELRKSYGEQWLKGNIPRQDLPLPLVNRLKQDSGLLPHTLTAQHAPPSTSSEPQRNTTTTPVTTPLPAHPAQHTPQRSTSTSASTGKTASDSAKRAPREMNLPLERNAPKAVGKRRHASSSAKPHTKNLDPLPSLQQVSTGEDVFTEEDEDTGTAGEERYWGSLNRPSHVRTSPQTSTTKSEVRFSSELVDSETQTSLYHHHHNNISTQTSQIHNTNVTTRTGEERKKKKKKSQGICPESGESGRERPRSSTRSLMTSPGRSTGTERLPMTSSVTPDSSVNTVADSPAASSDGHGTYEDLRIQLEKVQTMYQDNYTSDCTTPTLSPQPHRDERLHFSHPLRSPPPPVPRPRTRNSHSRAHTVPACNVANLSDDIRKGLTKYNTDKVKTVSNSNTNDTRQEHSSSEANERNLHQSQNSTGNVDYIHAVRKHQQHAFDEENKTDKERPEATDHPQHKHYTEDDRTTTHNNPRKTRPNSSTHQHKSQAVSNTVLNVTEEQSDRRSQQKARKTKPASRSKHRSHNADSNPDEHEDENIAPQRLSHPSSRFHNTYTKPGEPEDEDIATDRPSRSKQRVRGHPKEEEQNDQNIKREIRSVGQNQVNPGKQRMREDEDDEDEDDGQRRSGQRRPVPGPRPDRRRALPTDIVDRVLDNEVLIKIAQSVNDRKRQAEKLRFRRRANSRPSEEPPRDPSHQYRGQGQEVRGDRSTRPRARHVPQDDLDLPHVETDGATSGLGDSCHSQELLDY